MILSNENDFYLVNKLGYTSGATTCFLLHNICKTTSSEWHEAMICVTGDVAAEEAGHGASAQSTQGT